jgi:vitamin B12 transporter
VTDYLWVKATLFRHDLTDNIVREYFAGGPPGCEGSACNDLFVNKGDVTRQGIEFELETVPFHNFSFRGGFALYDKDPSDSEKLRDYAWNLALKYDDRKSFMAQLFGHYMWWDPSGISPFLPDPDYDDFIWELNLRKKIFTAEKNDTELFLTVHNIFNGAQYQSIEQENPDRWLEAGVRFKF